MTDTPLQTAFIGASESFKASASEVLRFLQRMGEEVRGMQEAGMDIGLEVRPRHDGSPIPPVNTDPSFANGTFTISGTKVEFTLTRATGFSAYLGGVKLCAQSFRYVAEEKQRELVKRVLLDAKAEIDLIKACSVPADGGASGPTLDKPRPGLCKN